MAKKPKTPATQVPAASEQPYYLQRAHIKDFRSIRDAKVEFKPGLNIIIGANGSGKTNFLNCVANGLSITNRDFIGGSGSSFLMQGINKVELNYKINYHISDIDLSSYYIIDEISPQDLEIKSGDLILKGESILAIIGEAIKINSSAFSELMLGRVVYVKYGVPSPYSFADENFEFIINEKGQVSNRNNKGDIPLPLSEIRGVLSNFFVKEIRNRKFQLDEFASIAEFAVAFWTDFLKYYLNRFSPIEDVRNANPIQAYNNASQKEIIVKGFIGSYKVNGDWLPFEALSSGTQRIYYIISEISAPSSSSLKNNLFENEYKEVPNKIILLEEPELGIHPDQLHKLLLFLREQSEKHQIIITTHSPQVLDMLNEDELDRITICELDEKKGTRFRKLKKTQIATAKKFMHEQGLFLSDYWRYGNLEGVN